MVEKIDGTYISSSFRGNRRSSLIVSYYTKNGERRYKEYKIPEDFKPRLGWAFHGESEWKSLNGTPVYLQEFNSINEYYEAAPYGDIHNPNKLSPLHDIAIPTQLIAEVFPRSERSFTCPFIRVGVLDIEVDTMGGFAKPDNPFQPIVALTYYDVARDKKYVFSAPPDGQSDYVPHEPNVRYFNCSGPDGKLNEAFLIKSFIDVFSGEGGKDYPDVLTGWFSFGFDIPYFINRIKYLAKYGQIEEKIMYKLSPFRTIREKRVIADSGLRHQDVEGYTITGVAHLDYIELYRKFQPGGRESFTLDYISKYELGKEKVDYRDKYGDLATLYRQNFQLFVEYNIYDADLVKMLDDKLQLIQLGATISYMAGLGDFEQVLGTLRIWEAYLYNILNERKIATPTRETKRWTPYPGAFVKEPIKGLDEWVISFDVASEYPTCLISNNISPERKINENELPEALQALSDNVTVDGLVNGLVDTSILEEYPDYNLCVAWQEDQTVEAGGREYGQFYYRDGGTLGFIPEVVKDIFEQRKTTQKEMRTLEQQLDDEMTGGGHIDEYRYLEDEIAAKDQIQYALKILLNSLYGAYANKFFPYYDVALASSITLTSQFYIKSVEKAISEYLTLAFGPLETFTAEGVPVVHPYIKMIDTDSVYVRLGTVVTQRFPDGGSQEEIVRFLNRLSEQVLLPVIEKAFHDCAVKLNSSVNYMSMGREKICGGVIALAKKKYAYMVLDDEGKDYTKNPKIDQTGIQVVRSDSPQVIRDWLKESLRMAFLEDNDTLIDFIREKKKEFFTLPFEAVAFPKGVNTYDKYRDTKIITVPGLDGEMVKVLADKEHDELKGLPIQVRASMVYNQAVKKYGLENKYPFIAEGEKIKFAYMIEPNVLRSNVIGISTKFPHEWKDIIQVDYGLQWKKAFINPLKDILDTIGWTTERVVTIWDMINN